MKIFISGPMSGIKGYNRKEFHKAEKLLCGYGHITLNPAKLPDGLAHEEYLSICLSMIDVCDAIFMLTGWQKSDGAVMEREYAERTGKKIMGMLEG